MARRTIECLNCGTNRRVGDDPGECTRCGYVGWAEAESLTETLRRALREGPVERLKLHVLS
jgi:Zn ribbon nucleic-acid-binding protein